MCTAQTSKCLPILQLSCWQRHLDPQASPPACSWRRCCAICQLEPLHLVPRHCSLPVRQLTQCISPYQTQPRWHAAPKNSSPHAILQECCSNHPNVRMPVGFMAKAPSALSEQPSRCGPFLHLSSCQSHDLDPVSLSQTLHQISMDGPIFLNLSLVVPPLRPHPSIPRHTQDEFLGQHLLRHSSHQQLTDIAFPAPPVAKNNWAGCTPSFCQQSPSGASALTLRTTSHKRLQLLQHLPEKVSKGKCRRGTRSISPGLGAPTQLTNLFNQVRVANSAVEGRVLRAMPKGPEVFDALRLREPVGLETRWRKTPHTTPRSQAESKSSSSMAGWVRGISLDIWPLSQNGSFPIRARRETKTLRWKPHHPTDFNWGIMNPPIAAWGG